MDIVKADGQLNARYRVMHRTGYPLAELRDPENGGQVSVVVFDTQWSKQYQVPTHVRYFRSRMDAMRFIKKTFK